MNTLKQDIEKVTCFIKNFPPGHSIFADTSALIYLAKVDLLPITVQSYNIHLALEVVEELSLDNPELFPETTKIKPLINRCVLQGKQDSPPKNQTTHLSESIASLDLGERATALYYDMFQQGFILTDDYQLIKHCKKHTIPFTSTIIMPCLLYYYAKIDRIVGKQTLTRIYEIGYVSDEIYTIAERLFDVLENSSHF